MNRKTFFNLIWYSILYLFKILLPLSILPIFTNHISIQDFGIYALALFFGTFTAGIANLGLTSIFERNFFEYNLHERKTLLWNIILFVLFLVFILSSITFIFRSYIAKTIFLNSDLKDFLLLAFLLQSFKSLNLYFLNYLKNSENAKKFTYLSIIESSLSIGIAFILVVNFSTGLFGFILGQTLGVGLVFFGSFMYLFYPFQYRFNITQIKGQLRLSLPLTPRIFFGAINTQFDRYMLGLVGLIGGVGLFDIGQRIANTSFTFMTTLQNIYAPKVYNRFFSSDIKYRNSIGNYLTPFLYVSIFFCLIIGIFSSEILILLTPKEFHEASSIVTILCLLYGFYFFGKQPQLLFAKKTGLISILSFVTISLNIGLNYPMIKLFGVMGAVWATTIAGILSTGIHFYFGQKYAHINYEKIVFVLFAYFVFSLISIYLLSNYFPDLDSLIKIKFLFVIGYFLIGIKAKILKKSSFDFFQYFSKVNEF